MRHPQALAVLDDEAIKCPHCGRLCMFCDIRGLGFALVARCVCGHEWEFNSLWRKMAITPAGARQPERKPQPLNKTPEV